MSTEQMLNRNCFVGREGLKPSFIILHGTAGGSSAMNIATYFKSTEGTANPVSSHYVVGADGAIVQCVLETDGAWCNGVLSDGHDSVWDSYQNEDINPNNVTVSIEHVKPATDNSSILTEEQMAASFTLIKGIADRWSIPYEHILPHSSLDPVNRSNCPGPYPWDKLKEYMKGSPVSTPPPHDLTPLQQNDALAEWNLTESLLKGPQPFTSGIARSWKQYYARAMRFGPPVSAEYSSFDWSGKHIICQEFLRARAEYNPSTGETTWYDGHGKVE